MKNGLLKSKKMLWRNMTNEFFRDYVVKNSTMKKWFWRNQFQTSAKKRILNYLNDNNYTVPLYISIPEIIKFVVRRKYFDLQNQCEFPLIISKIPYGSILQIFIAFLSRFVLVIPSLFIHFIALLLYLSVNKIFLLHIFDIKYVSY